MPFPSNHSWFSYHTQSLSSSLIILLQISTDYNGQNSPILGSFSLLILLNLLGESDASTFLITSFHKIFLLSCLLWPFPLIQFQLSRESKRCCFIFSLLFNIFQIFKSSILIISFLKIFMYLCAYLFKRESWGRGDASRERCRGREREPAEHRAHCRLAVTTLRP